MNILIINSVPLNGGDEALLEATVNTLHKVFSNSKITVLCSNYRVCQSLMNEYSFLPDYEYAAFDFHDSAWGISKRKLKRALNNLGVADWLERRGMLQTESQRRVIRAMDDADLVISSPGGYLHDYYGYAKRLTVFEQILHRDKPLVLLAQSIGPFWKSENIDRLKAAMNKMLMISVREAVSMGHLEILGIDRQRLWLTTDNAFLLYDKDRKYSAPTGDRVNVAMAFRSWKSASDELEIIEKAAGLCCHILSENDCIDITFLSTCQGIPAYQNDVEIAQAVVARLPVPFQERCLIDDRRYRPRELINRYAEFHAYVGMRLHGAILSMLGNTPAFNIGYEVKSMGIYDTLGLSMYQLDYKRPLEEWVKSTTDFLRDSSDIRDRLPRLMAAQHATAFENIVRLKSLYEECGKAAPINVG